jgi:hypothetical protein
MAEINIERLTLRLSGISEQDGQHLSRLIAEELAAASFGTEGVHHLDAMRVNVTASPGGGMDGLAKQIVADVLRQLERTL